MIPIGILTRNRHRYLDVTLRSLSASSLPPDVRVVVYNDNSDDPSADDYLYRTCPVGPLQQPVLDKLSASGLGIVASTLTIPHGIAGKVPVVKLSAGPALGVFNASCRAITDLFLTNPEAPGVILLQDDVIFKEDWYSTLLTGAGRKTSRPMGVLAGIRLNRTIARIPKGPPPQLVPAGATAQCLYISRGVFNRLQGWFARHHNKKKQFDDDFCKLVTRMRFFCGLIYPFVCQHIGLVSSVRPKVDWHRKGTCKKGRIGYYAKPPYVIASEVRSFRLD